MTSTTSQTNQFPPEMQDRIAKIIDKAKANAPGEAPAEAEAELDTSNESVLEDEIANTELTLMHHTIALRREVCALRQELNANSQVTDAVGRAVGQMYAQ